MITHDPINLCSLTQHLSNQPDDQHSQKCFYSALPNQSHYLSTQFSRSLLKNLYELLGLYDQIMRSH